MLKDNGDLVRRWASEVQDATQARASMVQYHALGLLYHMRQKDRLSITKMVTTLARSQVRSPLASCLLIRYALRTMADDDRQAQPLFELLEGCMRHRSEMVIYEAARAVCALPGVTLRELSPAVSVLQLFLISPKPTMRFAAVRTLSKVAIAFPQAVAGCCLDMENLIADSNRSIATLAITTLLRAGNESSIDRLMKQIGSFMAEIPDEFKIVVVDAVKTLCLKFPQKYATMMGFLSEALRSEGGFEFKRAVVDTVIVILHEIPDAKAVGLQCLCEFIEDCDHALLSTRVMHLLGSLGPDMPHAGVYVRHIYNRILLENSTVRAAAVSALAKFGAGNAQLRRSVLSLLARAIIDVDDEVRDRAVLFRTLIESHLPLARQLTIDQPNLSAASLERALLDYVAAADGTVPFDLSAVPAQTAADVLAATVTAPAAGVAAAAAGGALAAPGPSLAATEMGFVSEQASALASLPGLPALGALFKTSEPVEVTEAETEYEVRCIKHMFPAHVVFEFICKNTLAEAVLEDASVEMECPDGFVLESTVPAARIMCGSPAHIFAVVRLPSGAEQAITGIFANTLKYTMKECDTTTGAISERGQPDEYALEEVELVLADHIRPVPVPNFGDAWEELGEQGQVEETFLLSNMQGLEQAVAQLIELLGMAPCERTGRVERDKTVHTLLLSGIFRGGRKALAQVKLAFKPGSGVAMQLCVRAAQGQLAHWIAAAVN